MAARRGAVGVDVLDRIRWQLEGWLRARQVGGAARPAALPGCGCCRSRRCRPACTSRPCGADRAPTTSGPTGRWPGCRHCSGTVRCSPGGRRRARSAAAHPAGAVGRRPGAGALPGAALAGPATRPGAVGADRPTPSGAGARRGGPPVVVTDRGVVPMPPAPFAPSEQISRPSVLGRPVAGRRTMVDAARPAGRALPARRRPWPGLPRCGPDAAGGGRRGELAGRSPLRLRAQRRGPSRSDARPWPGTWSPPAR